MSQSIPFNQRFGMGLPERPLDKEVPKSARIGLLGILNKLEKKNLVLSWSAFATEALHVGRRLSKEFPAISDEDICEAILKELPWDKFYIFCERVYRLLQPAQYFSPESDSFVVSGKLEESQVYFTEEINELLAEENLVYEFADGIFQRRGRPQTRKSLQLVSAVLSNPNYTEARKHYNKALGFFNERPNADVENCIKEAVCALEAFVEILLDKKASSNFEGVMRARQGNADGQISHTICESIIKLRAFRGNAKGVAHAAIEGGFVSEIEAELVLNLVASYITYLHDKFPSKEEEIPF